jgi:hypothetical protein
MEFQIRLHRFLTFGLILTWVVSGLTVSAQTNPKHIWVETYSKDGKLVQGHYRTAPNKTNRDNFSTKGNINPYTKEPGWITPDNVPVYDPKYSYKFDTSTSFDKEVEDCSGYFFGDFRIGQFQRGLESYTLAQKIEDNKVYEVKSTDIYSVHMVTNSKGFMIGYVVETSEESTALQLLQNFVNYHSLPSYNDQSGVLWINEEYTIAYVKLDSSSVKIRSNGKYRFSVTGPL